MWLIYSSPKWGFWKKTVTNKLFGFMLKSKHWIYILDVAPRELCKRYHVANQVEKTHIHESIWNSDADIRQWHLSHGQDNRMTVCRAAPQLHIQLESTVLMLLDTLIKVHHPERLMFLAEYIINMDLETQSENLLNFHLSWQKLDGYLSDVYFLHLRR